MSENLKIDHDDEFFSVIGEEKVKFEDIDEYYYNANKSDELINEVTEIQRERFKSYHITGFGVHFEYDRPEDIFFHNYNWYFDKS